MEMYIDPFEMQFASPAEFGMLLRAAAKVKPAFYDERRKLWVMLRHRHVHAALRDAKRFSASFYAGGPLAGSFLELDGDAHHRARVMFARAIAPLAMRRAEEDFVLPAVRRIIGALAAKDGADLVEEFSLELPMQVIGDLLGVGIDFIREYVCLVPALIKWIVWWADPKAVAEGRVAHKLMLDRMRPFVERQIDQPGDNLVGALVRSQREDGPVDGEMILHLATGLILGGYETTAGMLASTLTALLMHPEALERVLRDPEMLMPAVEEAGRWANPGIGVLRRAMCDVDLGEDVVIPKDSGVLLCSVSAHFDDDVFPRPDVYDIDRRPDNMIFGGGAHHCLGAPLARLEARVGLSMLLERLPGLRLDPERSTTFGVGVRGTVINGAHSLHVRYNEQQRRKAA